MYRVLASDCTMNISFLLNVQLILAFARPDAAKRQMSNIKCLGIRWFHCPAAPFYFPL